MRCLLLLALLSVVFANVVLHTEISSVSYSSGQNLVLHWELENQGTEPISFLKWGTPLEDSWNSNIVYINHEELQHRAEYQGRLMKRATPGLEDYALLLPGHSKSGDLILSEGYRFYTAGTYSVRLGFFLHLLSGEMFPLESQTFRVVVERPDQVIEQIQPKGERGILVSFTGCSSTQQSTVNTAISNAISASANAEAYMNANRCTSDYVTWFGTYTSSRFSTITSDFQKINAQLASKNFGIDCTCNQPGTYAFVYPTDTKTHTIHLCPVFWSATANPYNWNSQPGTLTHEMSHFNDIAATDDIQYGVSGCLSLAQSNPSAAVNNADSHEYFQESKPVC